MPKVKDSITKSTKTAVQPGKNQQSTDGMREDTRSKIALTYVWGFLIIITIGLIGGGGLIIFKIIEIEDMKDILITLSGVLSGQFGFIIGYYFKAGKEK